MELLLIRHGRPATQVGEGPADPELTERGRAEAELLARWLDAGAAPRPEVVVTSPMNRARQTAQALVDRLGVPLLVDERLCEFDHGAPAYVPAEQASAADVREMWTALETGRCAGHRFDPDAFEARVAAAFADVVAGHGSAVVAVVCHGGVINSFLGPVVRGRRGMFFAPDYTSVSRVLASGDRRQVVSLNETGHLALPRFADRAPAPDDLLEVP